MVKKSKVEGSTVTHINKGGFGGGQTVQERVARLMEEKMNMPKTYTAFCVELACEIMSDMLLWTGKLHIPKIGTVFFDEKEGFSCKMSSDFKAKLTGANYELVKAKWRITEYKKQLRLCRDEAKKEDLMRKIHDSELDLKERKLMFKEKGKGL